MRSVAERQVCLRVDGGPENTHSLRSEDANRDAEPTEVDSTRFEETPDVVDSTLRVPVEFSDEGGGVPAPGNAEMVSGPKPHVPDIRIDETQLSARRGSRQLVLNSQNSHIEWLVRVRHVLLQERIDFQQRQANGVAHVHIGTPRDQSASEGVETHGEDSWSVTTDEESEAGEPEVSVPDEETPGEVAATPQKAALFEQKRQS